jgi:5-methylcytosine-specific restriction endonuclease McrA
VTTFYPLHIDLLRCEFCGQHNKLLEFCSACGRARKTVIVVPLYEHKNDRPLAFRCRECYSQRSREAFCLYCNRGMKLVGPAQRPVKRAVVPGQVGTRKTVQRIKSEPSKYVRELVYKRDGHRCLRCDSAEDLTLHHIEHRALGGTNKADNLQTLCSPCHVYLHDHVRLPSGTPYVPEATQEDEDRAWHQLQQARTRKHGKKPGNYQYGKALATNMAAPFIARLRKEIDQDSMAQQINT